MKKHILALSFLLASVLMINPMAIAQVAIGDSVGQVKPQPIPLDDIMSKIELAIKQLKNVDKKTEINKSVRVIDSLLPLHQELINQRIVEYKNFRNSHPNKQKVINLINKWGSYNAYLDTWQKTLKGFIGKNTVWMSQIEEQDKQWAVTLESLEESKKTDLYKNIVEIKKAIDEVASKLKKQTDYYLDLETDILIQKESVTEVVDNLEQWKQSEKFSIAYRRHPAIWNLEDEVKYVENQNFDPLASFKGNLAGIVEYLKSPENNIPGYSIVLLLLGIWLYIIKRSFKNLKTSSQDAGLSRIKGIIVNKLPWVIVFIFGISTIVYFTHTPLLLGEILLLICLVSSIPIINSTIHPKFRGLTFLTILLYIMNTTKSYVWYSSTFYRIYLFIEAFLVLAILLKYAHPYLKTRRLEVGPVARSIIKLSPVVLIFVIGAFVSNILGYTNLTDLLIEMCIKGAVLLVVFYSMLTTLQSLAKGSVHYHFSKLTTYDLKYRLYIENKLKQAVSIFSYTFLIVYFLHVIDLYDLIIVWFTEVLSEPLQAGTITFTWGSILMFGAVLMGSYIITSFISRMVDGGALNIFKLPKGVPSIISVVLRYFLIAFGFIIALSYLGIELGEFNLMAGALGLGIGFGLQNIISNFISGLILIFERPIQNNDVIEVGPLLGQVRKIGVRSSNIRTFNGAEVVVPNNNLISNEVINWTLSDNVKRIEINIGASYGTDLQQVVDILQDVATKNESVLKEPSPRALFDKFGDSSLDFRLLYWVRVDDGIQSKSDISIAVYNRFKEEGITIPFPQRDINFKKEDLDKVKGLSEGNGNTSKVDSDD